MTLMGNFNTATISIPKNTSLFQNAAKRKIRGTAAHEVEHGVQDIRKKKDQDFILLPILKVLKITIMNLI